jgi:hypothetical protein
MFRTDSQPDTTVPQLQQVRRLTVYLIASGSLNIILLVTLLYSMVGGGFLLSSHNMAARIYQVRDTAIADDRTNAEVLRALAFMLPEQLVARLTDAQLVEDGFSQRDLALGCLVSLHHLDLVKALRGSRMPSERFLDVETGANPPVIRISVYPGLSDSQYSQVVSFVNTERWPLTSEGLFLALKQPKLRQDPSLAEAFFLTPEFLTLQRLFARTETLIDRTEILDLLLQGDWNILSNCYITALEGSESSVTLRRRLLVTYILSGSKMATYLMLKSDGIFAAKKLDDPTILAMLKTMDTVTPEVEAFVAELVRSPRSDPVLEHAHKLCCTALVAAVTQIEEKQVQSVKPRSERVYVVQRGDSLWKISRQHKVDVTALRAYNGLQSDLLKPGATLRIP